jgi:transcription elongation factor Elf1
MEYITKTCPVCGHEFVVLQEVEKKAIYCTLKCLLAAQGKINRENFSPAMSA